jgi:hypothetical protein
MRHTLAPSEGVCASAFGGSCKKLIAGNELITTKIINALLIMSSSLSNLVSFAEIPRLKLFPFLLS